MTIQILFLGSMSNTSSILIQIFFRVPYQCRFSFGFHVNGGSISGFMSMQFLFRVLCQCIFSLGSMSMRVLFRVSCQCEFNSGSMSNAGFISGSIFNASFIFIRFSFRVPFRCDFYSGFYVNAGFIASFISGFITDAGFVSVHISMTFYLVHIPLLFYFVSYTAAILFQFLCRCQFISVLTSRTIEFLISPTQSGFRIGLATFIIVTNRQNFRLSRI